jgi:two-component sensor histidine kinase
MHIALKILIIVLLHVNSLAIEVDSSSSNIDLLSKSQIYLDKNSSLTKEDVSSKYIDNKKSTLTLGVVPHTRLWIKFSLKNSSPKTIDKILEYTNPETETLYFYDANTTTLNGMFHIDKERISTHPTFNITLAPFEEKTFYLSAQSKTTTLIAGLTLWNEIDYIHDEYGHKLFLSAFFAVIFTLLIYNFMLYLYTQDSVYLYYITFLTSVIIYQSIRLGVAQLYFFSNDVSIFVTQAKIGYTTMLVIPMILFSMKFLKTYRFKKIHFILKFYLFLLPIISLLSFNNFLFNMKILLLYFPLAFSMIYASYLAYTTGTKEAKLYLIAWSGLIVSLILSVLRSLGVFDAFVYFSYITEVAFLFEALLFSIALAHRINILSMEKNAADDKLIKFQQKERELLTVLVDDVTNDLRSALEQKEILYRELNHRVKNNIQMILALINLQISSTNLEQMQKELTTTKNRINSMAKLYEILDFKNNIGKIGTLEYFTSIVEYIQSNFPDVAQVKYEINYNISFKELMYCGLIVNELVTNSFKYAFENAGTIKIKTSQKGKKIYMIIEDNGRGFQETRKNSLGLTIVKILATKQLCGTMQLESKNGTKHTIVWDEE